MNKATVLRLLQEGKSHLAREWHFYLDDMIAFARNDDTLWSIIQNDIPDLLKTLERLRQEQQHKT